MARFRVADPNQYLVKTGWGIEDVKICKKGWVFVGQKATILNMTPLNYSLSLQAMTFEKLEFTMPAVFTIGPHDDFDEAKESLMKYAKTVAEKGDSHLNELVKGIIEGESRVVAANMRMEEIFNARKEFQMKIMDGVQHDLSHFGLRIFNANIKELADTPGSEYFQYMRTKTHEGAVNQAKIEVARAKYAGDVGEKSQQAVTRQELAALEAETVIQENRNRNQILAADAELAIKEADYNRKVEIAKVEGVKATEARKAQLQKEVEELRLLEETERHKADILSINTAQNQADMETADAEMYAAQRLAEAALYAKQKEAEGLLAVANAQALGLTKLALSFNNDHGATLQYLMIERGLFKELAQQSAQAVQGLKPKINVWTTGSGENGGENGNGGVNPSMKPIHDIFQSLPPLLNSIQEQTGISGPAWLSSPNLGTIAARE